MKKIITLLSVVALVLIGSDNLFAQSKSSKSKTKPQPVKLDPMFYKGGKFTVGYDVIPQEKYRNYFNPEEFQRVNKAFQMRNAGMGLMIAGGATTLLAGACMAAGMPLYHSDDEKISKLGWGLWWGGIAGVSLGSATLISGIPVFCVADGKLKKAANGYNKRNNIQVTLNLNSYGPGLALNF